MPTHADTAWRPGPLPREECHLLSRAVPSPRRVRWATLLGPPGTLWGGVAVAPPHADLGARWAGARSPHCRVHVTAQGSQGPHRLVRNFHGGTGDVSQGQGPSGQLNPRHRARPATPGPRASGQRQAERDQGEPVPVPLLTRDPAAPSRPRRPDTPRPRPTSSPSGSGRRPLHTTRPSRPQPQDCSAPGRAVRRVPGAGWGAVSACRPERKRGRSPRDRYPQAAVPQRPTRCQ